MVRERVLEIVVNYTESFKAKMVQRMVAPNAISAISLSKEVGVSQSQLSLGCVRMPSRTNAPIIVTLALSTLAGLWVWNVRRARAGLRSGVHLVVGDTTRCPAVPGVGI